jgi:hypothetical protein
MLSPEDKDDIERMLKPFGEAAKSQAKSIENQAGHLGKMGERMASVETDMSATKKLVEDQAKRCQNISSDLYNKVNPLPADITEAQNTADEANDRSKWLRYVLIGLIISVALLGLKIAWDVVSALNAAE